MEKKEKKTTNIEYFDYKDILKLKSHMNAHSRIMGRGRTGLSSHEQRNLATAVKRARFMALVPYVSE